MTDCRDFRVRLLEAEPEELASTASSELASHLTTCSSCRAAADAILEETAALDRYLAQAPAGLDVDAIIAAASRSDAGRPEARNNAKGVVLRFPEWRRWTALAAAAAIAGLFLLRPDAPMPGETIILSEAVPLVEAAPDQNVAVMATADPDITVLWFF